MIIWNDIDPNDMTWRTTTITTWRPKNKRRFFGLWLKPKLTKALAKICVASNMHKRCPAPCTADAILAGGLCVTSRIACQNYWCQLVVEKDPYHLTICNVKNTQLTKSLGLHGSDFVSKLLMPEETRVACWPIWTTRESSNLRLCLVAGSGM